MLLVSEGRIPNAYIDSNLHVNIKFYTEIISDGSHKYVNKTQLSSFLGKDNKSFVITKMLSSFHKEMRSNDSWSLFIGIYRMNSFGFSLLYELLVNKKCIARFHARCNYFDLSTRKSFQLNSDTLNKLKIDLIEIPYDPLFTK